MTWTCGEGKPPGADFHSMKRTFGVFSRVSLGSSIQRAVVFQPLVDPLFNRTTEKVIGKSIPFSVMGVIVHFQISNTFPITRLSAFWEVFKPY
jgi:hypothetical protein